MSFPDLSRGSDGKSVCLQCRNTGFDPWDGKIPWRRKWQLTPAFLPGESHGQRSLVGYTPWGRKESDMTERLHFLSLSLFTSRTSVLSNTCLSTILYMTCIHYRIISHTSNALNSGTMLVKVVTWQSTSKVDLHSYFSAYHNLLSKKPSLCH